MRSRLIAVLSLATAMLSLYVSAPEANAIASAEKPIVNTLKMKFVYVAPGKFLMGSPKDEENRKDDEAPHQVEITKGYYLSAYEVTQKQFESVMGYNPSFFCNNGSKGGRGSYYVEPAGGKVKIAGEDTSDFPVENVTFEEVVDFCNQLSSKESKIGRIYRLPTEAEWEYACRGGANNTIYHVFHYGNDLTSDQANFNGKYPYGKAPKSRYLGRTTKIGSYKPNVLGLYDMHGNVCEWCSDWYHKDYPGRGLNRDPIGPPEGFSRVFRGGSWVNDGPSCRSAIRYRFEPKDRDFHLGFRPVLVPTAVR